MVVLAVLSGVVTGFATPSLAESVVEVRIGIVGDVAVNWPTYVVTSEFMATHEPTETRSFATKLVRFESGFDAMEALKKGAVDVWAPAPTEMIVDAYVRGVPIVVGAGLMNKTPYRLVTRSDIGSVEELRFKTIGVSPLALAQERQMLRRLEKVGLKYSIDYSIRPVSGSINKVIALVDHTIDGAYVASEVLYLFSAGFAGDFELQDKLRVLDAESDFAEFPFVVAAYNRDWATRSANQAIVRRFTSRWSNGLKWLNNAENRARAIKLIVDSVGMEQSMAEAVYRDYVEMGVFSRAGELNCNRIIDLTRSLKLRSKYETWRADDVVLSVEKCIP